MLELATGEWPPFMSEALPKQGLVTDIVRQALAEVGANMKLHFYPWARAMAQVRAGQQPASMAWYRTQEREQEFLFSDPVFVEQQIVFFRKDRRPSWKRLEDLRDHRIGLTIGYFYGEALQRAEQAGQLRVDRAPSDERTLRKLLLGRVDVAVVSHHVGRHLLATRFSATEAAELGWDPRPINEGPLHLIFARTSQGQAWLQRFNQGLGALRTKGRASAR